MHIRDSLSFLCLKGSLRSTSSDIKAGSTTSQLPLFNHQELTFQALAIEFPVSSLCMVSFCCSLLFPIGTGSSPEGELSIRGTGRFNNQPALSLVGSADSTIGQLPLLWDQPVQQPASSLL